MSNQFKERKDIIDSTSEVLEVYQQDDKVCRNGLEHVPLERFKNAKMILDKKGLLIIKCTGKDGSTELGKSLLLEYSNTTKCIVGNVNEYTTCITGGDGPYSFLVDDAFGFAQFDGKAVDSWQTHIERHSSKRINGQLKLVFVLKKKHEPYCSDFLTRYKASVIDLSDSKNYLRNYEKQYILERSLKRKNAIAKRKRAIVALSSDAIERIGKAAVSFRFFETVELFLSKKSNIKQGFSFFNKPSREFYAEIHGWRTSNDEAQRKGYLTLVAIFLFDGKITNDDIVVLCKQKGVISSKFNKNAKVSPDLACSRTSNHETSHNFEPPIQPIRYKYLMNLASVMNIKLNIGCFINHGMEYLLGTFVKKEHDCYTFAHQAIEAAIYISIGQQFPDLVAKYASKALFYEYVGTDLSFDVDENRCIRVDMSNKDLCLVVCERLREALKKQECLYFITHPLMKDARFLQFMSKHWEVNRNRLLNFFIQKNSFLETIFNCKEVNTGKDLLILSVEHPFNVQSSTKDCRTLADWALKQGKWKNVRKLNPELAGRIEQVVMEQSCLQNWEGVYMALSESVSIQRFAMTCLMGAIHSGSLDIVREILTKARLGPNDYLAALKKAICCYANNVNQMRRGIVTMLDKYSDTKEVIASFGKSGRITLVTEALVVFDIDINEVISAEGPLLFLLTKYNHWIQFWGVMGYFSPDPYRMFEGRMCVHLAAECGRLKILQALFEINAGLIHEKDYCGMTPLHLSSKNGHRDSVVFLIQNAAAVNETDNFGQTALHKAACLRKTEVMYFLIANGGDVNIRDNENMTATDLAKQHNNDKVVRILTGEPKKGDDFYRLEEHGLKTLFNYE